MPSADEFSRADSAARFLLEHIPVRPRIALVLGLRGVVPEIYQLVGNQ